jgi:hypothetical protein
MKKSGTEIPCSICPYWNQKIKSFSCDPNKCAELSNWLLKQTHDKNEPQIEKVQYII